MSGSNHVIFGAKNAFKLRLTWSATKNVAGNYSRVTAKLYLDAIGYGGMNDVTNSKTVININGDRRVFNVSSQISPGQSKLLGSHASNVAHNGDGSKTFSISASHHMDITYSGAWVGTKLTSGSYTLDTIPRASSVRLNKTTTDIGTTVRITISRASSSFRHDLRYSFGNLNSTFASKITWVDHDWVVPNEFLKLINKAGSSWGRILVDTYDGATKIGTSEVKLTVTVPSKYTPTFSSVSIADLTTSVNNLVGAGVFVQSLSNIRLTLNGASGVVGSSISGYTIIFDGRTWNSRVANVGNISKSGTVSGSAYVTDSRGRRSATKTFSYSFLPYAPPTISTATVSRTLGGLGENLTVKRVGRISGLGGKNKVTAYLDYKVKSSPTWISLAVLTKSGAVGVEAFSFTDTTVGNIFGALESYDFRINIHDSITKFTANLSISTASATLSFGKNGIGVGKIHEGFETLEIGGGIQADRYASIAIPRNADLNDYRDEGFYCCSTDAVAGTVANRAISNSFSLFVERHAGTKQTFTAYKTRPQMWVRNYYSGNWGGWHPILDDTRWSSLTLRNVTRGELKIRRTGAVVNLAGWFDRSGEQRNGVAIANVPSDCRPVTDIRFTGSPYENHTSYPENHSASFLLKGGDGEFSLQRKTGVERFYINETYIVGTEY